MLTEDGRIQIGEMNIDLRKGRVELFTGGYAVGGRDGQYHVALSLGVKLIWTIIECNSSVIRIHTFSKVLIFDITIKYKQKLTTSENV